MATSTWDRRTLLATAATAGAAAAAWPLLGGTGTGLAQGTTADEAGETFAPDTVRKLAQTLAGKPFAKPKIELPEPFNKLVYDQYRDIRFRPDQAIWRGEKLGYELQLFPLGWLYDAPLDIWIVDNGRARLLKGDSRLFTFGPVVGNNRPPPTPYGFSGFRVHTPINRSDTMDEFVVFQGASYLRAVGRGQGYGLSARGLAINTARPNGEEFPLFRAFWIEKPAAGALELIVHALLDSPSATGAYRFVIQPGVSTVMDVEATLFARRTMSFFGLAPLTSMFIHGPAHRRLTGDFRPAVHDSEGLAIVNGRGERLWRPLTNPKKLQTSAFIDKDVKGFGLVQRDRRFANFEDLEARYERRPTAWVEPRGGWGEGVVELIEIPTEEEIHDNIVAYWRPAKPIEEQKSFAFVYRLHWADAPAAAWTGLRARKTRVGNGRKGAVLFVVDFDGPAGGSLKDLPAAELRASAGTVSKPVVQFNPEISGLRCSFELQPGAAELSELRLELWAGDQNVSEIWLYRWTRV